MHKKLQEIQKQNKDLILCALGMHLQYLEEQYTCGVTDLSAAGQTVQSPSSLTRSFIKGSLLRSRLRTLVKRGCLYSVQLWLTHCDYHSQRTLFPEFCTPSTCVCCSIHDQKGPTEQKVKKCAPQIKALHALAHP